MEQLTIQFRNESYRTLDDLGDRQKQVLDCIRRCGPATNKDIAKTLGLPINCITSRVKELRDAGVVEVCGSRYDDFTNRTVALFKVV